MVSMRKVTPDGSGLRYTLRVPADSANTPHAVDLTCETQTPTGWSYVARWPSPEGTSAAATVHMTFPDYELWSGGIEAPCAVVERGVRLAAAALGALPATFDLAPRRRRIERFDQRMRGLEPDQD
jgi:hypothetical protein